MTLDTFFEKFDLFADAPDAVAKMRELVLQLAVRGSLSADTEAWIQSPLGEVSRLRRGYDLPTQDRKRGTVPIFAANGPVGVHETHMVKGPGVVTGRSGSIGKVHFINKDFWPLNTALYVEDFFGNYPQFISLLLRSLHLERFSTATAVPTLNRNVVHKEIVKVPPLAEQKRIVAKVDELMALCDRLEAQQQKRETRHAALARASLARFADAPTPANLNFLFHSSFNIPPSDLRKSILTLAVQGKLVPQDPNDEPASNLIARAQEERRQLLNAGIIKRVKPLEDKSRADEFQTIPVNWACCCLDDIALKITDGEHATPVRVEKGHYLLSARNVRDGFIDVTDVDYVGTEEFERIRKRCDPNAGDILLSCSGSIGRVAVVDANYKYAMVRSAALIKHSQANVDSDFLSLALRSPCLQIQIERSSKQSAQANLFIEPIRRLVVLIPPLAEQKRIVAKVEQLMALMDQLEAQQAAARATAANLLAALVAELTGTSA